MELRRPVNLGWSEERGSSQWRCAIVPARASAVRLVLAWTAAWDLTLGVIVAKMLSLPQTAGAVWLFVPYVLLAVVLTIVCVRLLLSRARVTVENDQITVLRPARAELVVRGIRQVRAVSRRMGWTVAVVAADGTVHDLPLDLVDRVHAEFIAHRLNEGLRALHQPLTYRG